jgi:hypothetical protein
MPRFRSIESPQKSGTKSPASTWPKGLQGEPRVICGSWVRYAAIAERSEAASARRFFSIRFFELARQERTLAAL